MQLNRKIVSYVPGEAPVDLYDSVELIPFDKLTSFFTKNRKKARPESLQAADRRG